METRLLEYFLAIVDAGSISRAAETLHMTQPPLSAALSRLERNVGVTLLTRTGRGVTPTPAGQALAQSAAELLRSMDDIRARLRRIDSGLIGELRLAVVAPFLWGPLPRLLRRTVSSSAEIDVSISSPEPLAVIDQVRTGKADLGVVALTEPDSSTTPFGETLNVARAGACSLLVALPPRFEEAPPAVDLRTLDGETWVMPRSTLGVPSLPEITREAWAHHGITPGWEQTVESVDTGLALIAAGLGVALVPEPARTISYGGVVLREPVQTLPPLEFTMVWRRHDELPPPARRFLSLALDEGLPYTSPMG